MINERVLEQAAQDGSFDTTDPEAWPQTLQHILARLDEIIHGFPKPKFAPVTSQDLLRSSQDSQLANASQTTQDTTHTDKENENAVPATPPRPPVPAFDATPSSSPSQAPFQGIPAPTLEEYTYIRTTLSKNFSKKPPHTIQRLAELILQPKRHYRFLPPYLRALDRVVSVCSPATAFPLPTAVPAASGSMLNGATTLVLTLPLLGSDEALGGALLTPIPWLQPDADDADITDAATGSSDANADSHSQPQISSSHPDGESLPSTGPVTQGEILRQEQEAGVTLSNPHSIMPTRGLLPSMMGIETNSAVLDTVEPEEDGPHARGPERIGTEDIGSQKKMVGQGGLDIEGAVGRPSIRSTSHSPGPGSVGSPEPGAAGLAKNEKDDRKDGEEKAKDKNEDEEMKDEGDEKAYAEARSEDEKEKDGAQKMGLGG